MQIMKHFLIILSVSLFLTSCTKEIEMDLKEVTPVLVIEAKINDQGQPATVDLSLSNDFNDPNIYDVVMGATIEVADQNGQIWAFAETTPGHYTNDQLIGQPGITYSLAVQTTDGKSYTATSTMPYPVALDSLTLQDRSSFGPPTAGTDDPIYIAIPRYFDPAGVSNHYLFEQTLNGIKDKELIVRDDNIFNGKQNEQPIFNQDLEIHSGDTLRVDMLNIDPEVYLFFFSLLQSMSGTMNSSATPSNPVSNIKGDIALGYFSAYSVRQIEVVVP
jgi:Domain of unknown function (DUF4249)